MRDGRQPNSIARRLRASMASRDGKLWSWLRAGRMLQGFNLRRHAAKTNPLTAKSDGLREGSKAERDGEEASVKGIEAAGVRMTRFWNHGIDYERTFVMDTMLAAMTAKPPAPAASATSPPQTAHDEGTSPNPRPGEDQVRR